MAFFKKAGSKAAIAPEEEEVNSEEEDEIADKSEISISSPVQPKDTAKAVTPPAKATSAPIRIQPARAAKAKLQV